MKPIPRAQSERRLIGQSSEVRPEIRKLTVRSKQLYPPYNVEHLQLSRLNTLKGFQQLCQELADFNQELAEWKQNRHQIRNLVVTYNLYSNLYSRLRFVSVFSTKQDQAISSINETIKWFSLEKPEKRNYVPEVQPHIKPRQRNPSEQIDLQQLVQTNALKHQMQAYQMMSRTCHSSFFPPKQRLKQYRRKELAPFIDTEKQDKHPMSAAKTTATSSFNKLRTTYRDSLASRSSFKQTKSSFKFQDKKQSIPERKESQNLEAVDQQKQEENKEKIVNQEDIVQDSIIPKNFQQDEADKEGQNLLEESQQQDQGPKQLRIKKYARDPDPQQELVVQQKIKQKEQSTIRRIIEHKQQKIRIKLEQLDMKRHMNNWAKVKSTKKQQEKQKLQKMWYVNNFKDCEHRVIDPYQKGENQNKPPEFKMLHRSKSSHPGSIQSDIERIKIKNAIQTYGRYIKHGNISQKQFEEEDQQMINKYRTNSLTGHTQKTAKNKHFGQILRQNNPQIYNGQSQEQMIDIKSSLSRKNIAVKNTNLYKSLAVPAKTDLAGINMFSAGKNLPSNPFFPKSLFQNKKKKKK